MPGKFEDNTFFIGDFDDSLEMDIIVPLTKEIKYQSKKADGQIDLWINSFGGYSHLVMHLIELVEIAKRDGIKVRTIVPNAAFSAGSMLAVTGSPGERYISKHADHLVHYGTIASFETTPEQIKRYQKWKERQFKYSITHYKKYCDIPNLEQGIQDDGWFIPAADCIRNKMADRYMDKLVL